MRAHSALPAALLAAALLLPGTAADAQATPTPAQIVKALTPTGTSTTTRGIRVVGSAVEGPSINLNVDFASGSATLTPEATRVLDSLGAALKNKQLAGYRFRIEGHTDTVGSDAYNKALSTRRADRVAEYLQDKFDVPASRLVPVGMGKQGLLVPTPDQTPDAKNRRVLVVNIGI